LENYTYSIRNTLKDEKVKDKISAEDKEKCEKAVEEAVKWLEAHHNAEPSQFEAKLKELEELFNPIMMKVY